MTCFGPSRRSIRVSQCSVRGKPRPVTYDIKRVTCPKCEKAVSDWLKLGFVFDQKYGFVKAGNSISLR